MNMIYWWMVMLMVMLFVVVVDDEGSGDLVEKCNKKSKQEQ